MVDEFLKSLMQFHASKWSNNEEFTRKI